MRGEAGWAKAVIVERTEQKDCGHVLGESPQNFLMMGWTGKGKIATEGEF